MKGTRRKKPKTLNSSGLKRCLLCFKPELIGSRRLEEAVKASSLLCYLPLSPSPGAQASLCASDPVFALFFPMEKPPLYRRRFAPCPLGSAFVGGPDALRAFADLAFGSGWISASLIAPQQTRLLGESLWGLPISYRPSLALRGRGF